MPGTRPLLGTVRSVLSSVAVGTGAALAGLVIARSRLPIEPLRGGLDAVGNYLQTLGTIYAVLLAFVVFVVWSQFNEARAEVHREANDLLDLFRTASGLPEEPRRRLQDAIRDYAQAVLGREWSAMGCGDRSAVDATWGIIDRIWEVAHGYEPGTKCHEVLHAELLVRVNELSDARALRLAASTLRIPLSLKLLIYTGAVLTVGSMYFLRVDSAWLHAVMTGAVAGAIAHILYIVHDLDDCFAGDWVISPEPFERVLAYFQRTGERAAA